MASPPFWRSFLLWTFSPQNPTRYPQTSPTPILLRGCTALKCCLIILSQHNPLPVLVPYPCFSAFRGHLNMQLEFKVSLPAILLESYLYTGHWLVTRFQGQTYRVKILKGAILVGGENAPPASLTLGPAPPGFYPRNTDHNSSGR